MAATIEVDDHTYRSLEFAARMANTTAGDVVARLVAQASMPEPMQPVASSAASPDAVAVYADYDGHRTHGSYDRTTSRIDITSGPLAGRSFKSPTGAARAVVAHHKPGVSPSRNGWSFWILNDSGGRPLQTIRRS